MVASCRASATYVEVIVATDADPARAWTLSACAVRAGQALVDDPARCERRWSVAAGAEAAPFEGSFSVRPPSEWNGSDAIDLALFASAGPSAQSPSVSFRRRVRFSFVRGRPGFVRVFLPVQCGQSSADCARTPAAECTVARACEERGQTCGDDGACVAPELTVIERPVDASTDALSVRDVVARDTSVMDAVMVSDASDASDASDVSAAQDAGDAAPVLAARLVYPQPEATVLSSAVEFRWSEMLANGAVEICADRACSMVVQSFATSGRDRGRPSSALAGGRYFWRVAPRMGASSWSTSAVWAVYVRTSGCIAPPAYDVDSDGLGDVLAAAHQATYMGMANAGMSRFWYGNSPLLGSAFSRESYAGSADAHHGESLSFGDVDGDGFVDSVVSVPGVFMGAGQLSIHRGSATRGAMGSGGPVFAPATTARRGATIAVLGDIDGDGALEVAVASGTTGMESVQLFTIPTVNSSLQRWASGTPGTGFGAALASHCDLDGDTVPELVIGAPQWDAMGGAVLIYRGASMGIGPRSWTVTPTLTLRCAGANDRCGSSVSCGDIDGDGRHDLAVGAPGTIFGSAFVFRSTSTTSIAFSAATRIDGVQTNDRFGTSVSMGRDADGDGFCDLVVGAQNAVWMGMINAGSVSYFPGSTNGANRARAQVFSGAVANEQFGHAVSLLSDVNGDGRADILVGADTASASSARAGRIALYSVGTSGQVLAMPLLTSNGAMANDTFGGSIIR